MQDKLQSKIEYFEKDRAKKKRKRMKYLILALIAALCTTYLLILPAIAHNNKAYCGIEDHEHVLECFSNPDADVETVDDWKATFDQVAFTGDWAKDLVSIAETQLGYKESADNYIVLEDGETTLGYTRYGQWYGMPYGEWSGMFSAFCLNYAGVDGVTYDQDCSVWQSAAKAEDIYRAKGEYEPKVGDLAFLDKDGDLRADSIGIIREYITSEDGSSSINVIEGDLEDRVGESAYDIASDVVVGFIELPENPNPTEPKEEEEFVDKTEGTTYANNNPSQGDKYHSPNYLYYKPSSHTLTSNTLSDSSAVTFLLAPASSYTNNWKPSVKEWSAENPGNYVVAYCSDSQTYSSSSGENYMTYTLDKSRFADPEQRRTLDGIIKHAYPFLTSQQMKDQLANAYKNGEIKVDVRDCKESEFIAAAQWAIWDTTNVTGTFDSVSISGSIPNWGKTWNNLTYDQIGHSTNNSTNKSHVKAIRDWLVSQKTPVALEVSDYDAEVERTKEGLYNLDVTVNLNRQVIKDEEVDVKIVAGSKSSNTVRLATGATSFELSIDGLTAEQILGAEVDIQISSQGIQTHFYDSENYQDLIGGVWGTTSADLSFKLADETIDVSVTKNWNPNPTSNLSVKVQLYADGVAYGNKVTLNRSNNWAYTWTDVPKLNALLENVTYTIKEDPVPGYVSTVTTAGTSAKKAAVWRQVDNFEKGGTYILRSRSGYLEQHTFNNSQKLTWSILDISNPDSTPKESMWTASTNGSGFSLKNNKNTSYYLSYSNSTIYPRTSAAEIRYDGEHLYVRNSSKNYYFTRINTDGNGVTSTDVNAAASFDLFKLTEVDLPNSDVNFVLTNTGITETTSVDVTKEWAGKRNGSHPLSVEVTLLQNGVAYGNPVELSQDNNWTYKWTDLPAKAGSMTYEYTVEETPVGGYSQSITSTKDNKGQHITVTNTWVPEYTTMLLSKVDFNDPTVLLEGAVFELYGSALENEPIATISGTDGELGTLEQTITVGQNGTIVINNLIVGETYYLVEKEAPEGYNLLEEPIKFVIEKENNKNVVKVQQAQQWVSVLATDDGLAISVKNEKGYSLPETGGVGTQMFTIVGAILLVVTALLYLRKRSVKL